ncbi:MAG: NAD(P)-binding domain-containing protein [Alphaproteobacteria bacterium]
MNIGIIGSGPVGGTLWERWAKLGHKVIFGSRDPAASQIQDLVRRSGANASAASLEKAAADSELVVITLPWSAAEKVIPSLDLKGKIVFDCMNPFKADLSGLSTGDGASAGVQVAKWAKGGSVVKIFNTTGVNNMADSKYAGGNAAMFYCGGDERAKAAAKQLAWDLGFDPVDAGPIENSGLLENMAMLWVWLAFKSGFGREFAFEIARR